MPDKTQIITNPDKQERKVHGKYEFPFLVSYEALSRYESGAFLWHWHQELEWTYVIEGSMRYQINSSQYVVRQGEVIMGNSQTLHCGSMDQGQDCSYISITFDKRLLYGYERSAIQQKYVTPILENTAFASLHLKPDVDWQKTVIADILQLIALEQARETYWEMHLVTRLLGIWETIASNCSLLTDPLSEQDRKNYERIRVILAYIEAHYFEQIGLADLAKQVMICKSECCRLFKQYMNETLFAYLNQYRIEKSLAFLADSNNTIADAAWKAGFEDSNYYSKVFKKLKGISPRQYRGKSV